MRSILLITTVLILVMAAPSLAQEWTDYTSKTDFFHVNFPGDPKVQDINYQTEYGITLPIAWICTGMLFAIALLQLIVLVVSASNVLVAR